MTRSNLTGSGGSPTGAASSTGLWLTETLWTTRRVAQGASITFEKRSIPNTRRSGRRSTRISSAASSQPTGALVDDLLLVPNFKAEVRVKLVELARSFHRPALETDPSLVAAVPGSSGDASRLVKSAVNRNLGYQIRDEINRRLDGSQKPATPGERPTGPEENPRDVPDAAYPLIATGMARLEWTLLVIAGNLPGTELKALEDEIASITDKSDDNSSEARARFSRKLGVFGTSYGLEPETRHRSASGPPSSPWQPSPTI